MMKRFFALWSLTIAGLLASFTIALAPAAGAVDIFPACDAGGNAKSTDVCQEINDPAHKNQNPIMHVLKIVINILTVIIGLTAVIMIILSGMWFMTANGDAQAVARARGTIIYALVGIVIVILSQSLVAFVLNKV